MVLTPVECRLARKLLGWSQRDLGAVARVDVHTMSNFERERRRPYLVTVHSLASALMAGGIEFTNGDQPGVRLRLNDYL